MERIEILDKDTYEKTYVLRKSGEGGSTTTTSLPPIVILREAKRRQMTRDEIIEKCRAVIRFNSYPGCYVSFELKPKYRREGL